MLLIKKIKWDFSNTDFEECLYSEAIEMTCLPSSISTEELNEESNDYEIKEFLTEQYGFEVKRYVKED